MPPILLNHKALTAYYKTLSELNTHGVVNEGGLRRAFSALLVALAGAESWTLVEEMTLRGRIRPDGVLLDAFKIPRGYWEAKDSADDLEAEIRKKLARGYPQSNIIFEDCRRAVLVQDGRLTVDADMTDRMQLVALLAQFFGHTEPNIEGFHAAVRGFQDRIPDLASSVEVVVAGERAKPKFAKAFDAFHALCRQAIDPNMSADVIEKMLVQHILTERLFRTIFNDPYFVQRNAIAHEIAKVIQALSWNPNELLKSLDPFYTAIEAAAKGIGEYAEKQAFLNTVYERFFQGYSRDQADTHGIVYTPQPIVDFMVASVDAVLHREFGKRLSDPGVVILDPATGTGNFIVNILRRISRRDLKRKYQQELFANEIMLLPYYIAAMNIEHTYHELTGEYAPFEGICFTDTLDLAETQQLSLFAEENTERVERQKQAQITVIIGNPPYNVGQVNENDNNKNRRYEVVDRRVRESYAKGSQATNKNALGDVYVKFFRWATDRLKGQDGIVCFVSNNGFLNGIAFDGMRKQLAEDFTHIYHFDLKGNARISNRQQAEGGNVFQIRVGVGITIAIRNSTVAKRTINYYAIPGALRAEEKLAFLMEKGDFTQIPWQELTPDLRYTWLTEGMQTDYTGFLPIGTKETKAESALNAAAIFKSYGRGIATSRDDWAYAFDKTVLTANIQRFIESYNSEVDRWQRRSDRNVSLDDFMRYDDTQIKWSESLKQDVQRGNRIVFTPEKTRYALYRPFCKQYLFFDRSLIERVYQQPSAFPTAASESENTVICLTDIGSEKPFMVMITSSIPDLHLVGAGASSQCFPFYTYAEDGGNRRENITDWALAQFQAAYGAGVTKRAIFHYVYGLLHHPGYRERYAENLKRDLPRLPLVPNTDFSAFVTAGSRLMELHLGYEQVPEYRLQWLENRDLPFTWRVEKMKLTADKAALVVNPALTLAGIPPACFRYRLGNRSALEWVIDQYQVSTDKRSGIVSDPHRPDDEEYIVRLVGRVITVSVETMTIVDGLAGFTEIARKAQELSAL